jgi:hypothetical protein
MNGLRRQSDMKEIIGENMKNIFARFGIYPKETFSGSIGFWSDFKVWELDDAEFESLCNITEAQFERWSEEGAWWRYATGSNLGVPTNYFKVNSIEIKAWCGSYRDDLYKDYFEESEEEQELYTGPDDYVAVNMPYEYKNLFEYFCEELGASTEKNVCALAVDLAKYNGLTLSGLFKIYGGDTNGN